MDREKELLDKAGLDASWTLTSVKESTWTGVENGKAVPIRSTKAEFTKQSTHTIEFTEAA